MSKSRYRLFGQVIGELLLCSPIIAFSLLIGLWFECLLSIFCILFYKRFYSPHMHFEKGINCIITSYLVISLNMMIGKVFYGEYFLILLACSFISVGSCKLGELVNKSSELDSIRDEYLYLKNRYVSIESFDVCNCTRDQLLRRCEELKFSKENIDLCIKLFIDKASYNSIADEYCIEPISVGIRKMRLKKRLNK